MHVIEIYEFTVSWKSIKPNDDEKPTLKQRAQKLGNKVKRKVKQIIDPDYREVKNEFVDIMHIGTKLVFLNQPLPVNGASFYPIFNTND